MTKFGTLPEETVARINAVTSAAEIDVYLDRFIAATALEDIGLGP